MFSGKIKNPKIPLSVESMAWEYIPVDYFQLPGACGPRPTRYENFSLRLSGNVRIFLGAGRLRPKPAFYARIPVRLSSSATTGLFPPGCGSKLSLEASGQ